MARILDPSELEGDDLANWYQRSPADVEAEREAARQDQYNAFVSSIGPALMSQEDAAAAQVGPADAGPQQVPDRSGTDEAGLGDGNPNLVEARYLRPSMAPVMLPPSGPMVGPPLDARGAAPIGAPASGFFGQHHYLSALGGYLTDLPSPLNSVSATPAGWWELGDGSRVRQEEVDRIYAEQQRRLSGQDVAEPMGRVQVVDNWKDGQIPRASQLQTRERELDPTCAPNGGWERDPNFDSYPLATQRYEAQVTRAPGLDYVIRNPGQPPVKFDGCDVWDPQHPLLEAKGPGYAALIPKAVQYNFKSKMLEKAQSQASRQANAASDRQIEWHIAEPAAFPFFDEATGVRKPPIALHLTPAR